MSCRAASSTLALLLLLPTATVGYPELATRVPNGNRVPHPCKRNELWKGLGHFSADGGELRNPFGLAFLAAGKGWTQELCRADSDGDGRTNGEELGDPDCTWKPNDVPKVTSGLSHPGVCEPLDNATCQQKSFHEGVYRNQQEWMADVCKQDTFVCGGLDQPGVKSQIVHFPVTTIPAQLTAYKCAIFQFQDLADDVHMFATTPVIDNHEFTHHITLFGCTGDTEDLPIGTPYDCGMVPHTNCSVVISLWTLGLNGNCYHANAGVRMGLHGYKRVALQVHWNNPLMKRKHTDSSGMQLFYTPDLRPNDAAVLTLGNTDFVIPPGQERVLVESSCSSRCTRNILNQTIYVTAALDRMHYLGISQSIELVRNGVRLRYITNEVAYSYDSPKYHSFDTPIEVRPGDELRTKCYFNSTSRAFTTAVLGDSAQEEMCLGLLYYYPESALKRSSSSSSSSSPTSSCTTSGTLAYCDPQTLGGCDQNVFFQHLLDHLYHDVIHSCTNHGRCYAECEAVVQEARAREPCMRHAESWRLSRRFLVKNSEGQRFLGGLASCEAEVVRQEMEAACRDELEAAKKCSCEEESSSSSSSSSAGSRTGTGSTGSAGVSLVLMTFLLLVALGFRTDTSVCLVRCGGETT